MSRQPCRAIDSARVGRLYRSLFPRFQPREDLRPFGSPAPGATRLRWLGTAGYLIETATTTLLIDPYLTRAPLTTLATSKLEPDEKAIRARIPRRVDAVLCGHSHFDPLLDAPFIAGITGANLVRSPADAALRPAPVIAG